MVIGLTLAIGVPALLLVVTVERECDNAHAQTLHRKTMVLCVRESQLKSEIVKLKNRAVSCIWMSIFELFFFLLS